MSSHSCGACVKLHVQEEGWVSGWQMPVTCTPSPEGYWHMGEDVCLHWDVSEVASRSVLWASYPILARGEGGSFSPQRECVLLRPMLGQGEGCQGEANSVYVETQMVSFALSGPECDAVNAGGMGQPSLDRDSLLLAALPVRRAPSAGAEAVSWEPPTVWALAL